MFVGRKGEIDKLNGFFEGGECSVGVVSGSIGVGKTTLLKHFAEGKGAFFIEAYETTAKHQRQMFAKSLGLEEATGIEAICEHIAKLAEEKKVLIIIDQYTNIVRSDPEFDKMLHSYAVGKWKKLPIKLILCSDAFVLVEKYLKGKKALWRTSIKLDLEVKPFGFYDSLEFFGTASNTESAFLYGITGGIPYNLKKAAEMNTSDIKEVAIKLFLDRDYSVGLNPEQVMATELRELSYYNYMLTTLAKGCNRVNQISAEVDKPKDVVVPYLNSLMSIGVCTKDTVITEIKNRKKTRYSIVSTSTLFWYKYIVPNFDLYINGDIEGLWNLIEADMDSFMSTVFIKICSEYLSLKSKENLLPFTVEQIGNWWVNDDEAGTTDGFDLVSLGRCEGRSAIIFCQCYYTQKAIEVAQLKALIEKTKQIRRTGDTFYLVFSKSGFNENAITISSAIKNIMLISLAEMR